VVTVRVVFLVGLPAQMVDATGCLDLLDGVEGNLIAASLPEPGGIDEQEVTDVAGRLSIRQYPKIGQDQPSAGDEQGGLEQAPGAGRYRR
jgi:hypothetical protein